MRLPISRRIEADREVPIEQVVVNHGDLPKVSRFVRGSPQTDWPVLLHATQEVRERVRLLSSVGNWNAVFAQGDPYREPTVHRDVEPVAIPQ